ncbi:MAG: isocitrate/isopropylmalate dehydrogenase family protein [Rhodospirillales bacterium]
MKIAVLPCDAIGPEITAATMTVLETVQKKYALDVDYTEYDVGLAALEKEGTTFPGRVFEAVKESDGFIIGPHNNMAYPPPEEGGINVSTQCRKYFDLFANIRPAKSYGDFAKISNDIDLVIVRENTEGFYADRNMFQGNGEFMPTEDVALSLRKLSAEGCRRIAQTAFETARARPRKKVTAVHKANVLKVGEGLFLREVEKVAEQFPDVEWEDVIVDAMAAFLIREPERFDVIVTTNLYGDILSDEASELAGSLGLAPSINAGHTIAMAQAQHGSAPDIAGQDIANPVSLILSAAMLLDWLGRRRDSNSLCEAGAAIGKAVERTLDNPKTRTRDLGGTLGTQAFAKAVAEQLN